MNPVASVLILMNPVAPVLILMNPVVYVTETSSTHGGGGINRGGGVNNTFFGEVSRAINRGGGYYCDTDGTSLCSCMRITIVKI